MPTIKPIEISDEELREWEHAKEWSPSWFKLWLITAWFAIRRRLGL